MRTSSNLDLLANTMGGATGALAALSHDAALDGRRKDCRRLRKQAVRRGGRTDLGLVLLGLWLFAQLNPRRSSLARAICATCSDAPAALPR